MRQRKDAANLQRAWMDHVDMSHRNSRNEGETMGGLIGIGVAVVVVIGIGYAFVKQVPDLRRYLKMRRM